MSAYIVSKNHILYLVSAALSRSMQPSAGSALRWYWGSEPTSQSAELRQGDSERAADVANMLWRENMASVGERYSWTSGKLPGPVGGDFVVTALDFGARLWDRYDTAQVFKACDCYEYQTCEHDGWPHSEAHAFINALRRAAWHSMAGYDSAEWGAPKARTEKTEADFAEEKRAAMVTNAQLQAGREAVEKLQHAAFIKAFGAGHNVTIEPGQMALVAELNYDNSDSMTDYFDRHCGIGPEFVLAIGKAGRETESRARAALANFPQLAAIDFEWKTEKWSMGHGNYLDAQGGYVQLTPEMVGNRSLYRGENEISARWEITYLKAGNEPLSLPAFAGYSENPAKPAQNTNSKPAADMAAPVMIRRNEEKNGIEIIFQAKPETTVLEKLKAAGWRWSRFAACWYIRASAEAEKFAAELAAGMTGNAA